ncbi:MAG: LysR family transcriptional regulator [Rhizobiales bacterium]|nr:LysR family transcriptional regulator [Hyphomicrobiales bacterium]
MAKPARDVLPHLPWLRSFEAAARRLNFTLAGEELGLTQAAMSQHVTALEAALGVKLFHRRQRGVELTADGAAYLPHVQTALAGLARSTADLFGERRGTEIAIVTPISFTALWLAPRLADFRKANPAITLSITTAHVPADYPADSGDFEIRFGTGSWPGYQAWRLTRERLTPVCAPSLLPRKSKDWQHLPLLTVKGPREMWRDWFARAKIEPSRPILSFDSFVAAHAAAIAGAGILLGSRPLIDPALQARDLVRLSPIELESPNGHFLAARSTLSLAPPHQRVLEWFLVEAAKVPAASGGAGD